MVSLLIAHSQKKRGITEPSEKVLWISKSIQMCPKSQKKDKKFD